MGKEDGFHPRFESCARRIRARLALRHALTGAALGLAVAVVPAVVAWKTRHGSLRPFAPLVGAAGAAAGLARASRRRWSDTDVALYLDDHLDAEEAITTAVELRNRAEVDDEARAVVVTTAAKALADANAKRARPTVLRPVQLLAPVALAGLVFVAKAPLPAPPPAPPPAPGVATVEVADLKGLDRVAKLGEIDARDAEQKARLEQIAKDAEKLKKDLEKGMEKRDAQDRIARLRDEIAAERLTLGDGQERAGMEASQSKLDESALTKDAAKALGDHDLEAFDRDMEKLANQREKRDRDLAKQKLEDAAGSARASGAPEVGKALDDERRAMAEREKRDALLRDLAKGLEGAGESTPDVEDGQKSLDESGSDADAQKLADAMSKALEKLTPEERQRLADKLRKHAGENGLSPGDRQSLKDLADELSSPDGQKKLEDELRDLASQDDESEESQRQKDLDDAENGADEAEQGMGVPVPGQGQGQGQGRGVGGDAQNGQGGAGGSHDFGRGDHRGSTAPVDADALKSRAHARVNKGAAMPGSNVGFAPGRAGGTANVRGEGALKTVGPEEVQGVDSNDVPEEYQEQVRQYFAP